MICFLALVMWRYLEMWLDASKMGNCARQVLDQMATIHSMDVILPVKDKAELRLRVVSKPKKLTADLLSHLGLSLPNKPKIIENVVEVLGSKVVSHCKYAIRALQLSNLGYSRSVACHLPETTRRSRSTYCSGHTTVHRTRR